MTIKIWSHGNSALRGKGKHCVEGAKRREALGFKRWYKRRVALLALDQTRNGWPPGIRGGMTVVCGRGRRLLNSAVSVI